MLALRDLMYLSLVILGYKGTHLQVHNYRVIALENLDFRTNSGYSKAFISAPEVRRTKFLTSYERYKTCLIHTERSKTSHCCNVKNQWTNFDFFRFGQKPVLSLLPF